MRVGLVDFMATHPQSKRKVKKVSLAKNADAFKKK
jgi:hypothetical protein